MTTITRRPTATASIRAPACRTGRGTINSIGICLIATFIAIVFGTMAAYAIARLTFPGKATIVAVSLLISMFPQIALVTPLFKILVTIGLFDTWPGLIWIVGAGIYLLALPLMLGVRRGATPAAVAGE